MCGWTGDPASEWFVGSSTNGPRTDNSEQLPTGKYVYTNQQKFSAKKRLTSPVFSRTGPDCRFEMAYFIVSDQPDHPTDPQVAVSSSKIASNSLDLLTLIQLSLSIWMLSVSSGVCEDGWPRSDDWRIFGGDKRLD